MSTLTPDRFDEFFCALHGETCKPFPWQRRLAQQVACAVGCDKAWPEALALPTASGKTACLDIAVFALACQAGFPAAVRTAPRRIFFVVDRRVVVDEAFERAQDLRDKLAEARTDILREAADALRSLSGIGDDSQPLACFELRGGIYRDDAWARTPTQPTIITSTVDQIGSRLLYRSYGVSQYAWPIHAGLAGNDSLIILDEAHCSRPFMETLQAVRRYRTWAEQPLQLPFQVVLMSATPPSEAKDVFKANQDDLENPVLGARVRATKRSQLVVAEKAMGGRAIDELAAVAVAEALKLAGDGPPQAVAVILNRVAGARRAYELLQKSGNGDVVLLTGRMRPIDRDSVLTEWLPRLHASRALERKLDQHAFVVATQCLEVGANLDFDHLVSECASLDALRQRFGRLNRLGRAIKSRGVIVIRGDQTTTEEDPADQDPIYGNALPHTWGWLNHHANSGEIDMGVAAIQAAIEETVAQEPDLLETVNAAAPHAPVMLPAYLDCWVQTSPEPCPSPDISVFLHGPQRGAADVLVCWRADLDAGELQPQKWIDAVSLCPPATAECMSVPWHNFRGWYEGDEAADAVLSDVEGTESTQEDEIKEGPPRVALRWRGPENSELITQSSKIRPGDTVVLPTSLRGWEVLGHVPNLPADTASVDRGDEAHLRARGLPVLRVHPELLGKWPDSESKRQLHALAVSDDLAERIGDPGFVTELKAALASLGSDSSTPDCLKDAAQAFVHENRLARQVHLHPFGGFVICGTRRLGKYTSTSGTFADEDTTAAGNAPVALTGHSERVAELAQRFASTCGLDIYKATLKLAGLLHDAGKADPRLQALFQGGSFRGIASIAELLAKSDRIPAGARAYQELRRLTGYPVGGRHELVSMQLAESAGGGNVEDPDLFLHLVASHHGRCRPLAPIIDDPNPVDVIFPFDGKSLRTSSRTGLERLDSGVTERFWRLVRRYGWWGLAYLEATLRLSDHRVSEKEQRSAT